MRNRIEAAGIPPEIVVGGEKILGYTLFAGGLGWYKKTASHGPFVHIDVRGYRARWGD